MPLPTLSQLLLELQATLKDEHEADATIKNGNDSKAKAHQDYIIIMDQLRAKEYLIN